MASRMKDVWTCFNRKSKRNCRKFQIGMGTHESWWWCWWGSNSTCKRVYSKTDFSGNFWYALVLKMSCFYFRTLAFSTISIKGFADVHPMKISQCKTPIFSRTSTKKQSFEVFCTIQPMHTMDRTVLKTLVGGKMDLTVDCNKDETVLQFMY